MVVFHLRAPQSGWVRWAGELTTQLIQRPSVSIISVMILQIISIISLEIGRFSEKARMNNQLRQFLTAIQTLHSPPLLNATGINKQKKKGGNYSPFTHTHTHTHNTHTHRQKEKCTLCRKYSDDVPFTCGHKVKRAPYFNYSAFAPWFNCGL